MPWCWTSNCDGLIRGGPATSWKGRRCGLGPMRSASYVNSKCTRSLSMSEPATTTQAASAATSTSPKFELCFEFFDHPLQRVVQPLLLACECSTPYLSMILTCQLNPFWVKKLGQDLELSSANFTTPHFFHPINILKTLGAWRCHGRLKVVDS